MYLMILAALMMGSRSGLPPESWSCTNQIEVWCTADGCDAKRADETTPLSVQVRRDGRFAVCAYTGCWEGTAVTGNVDGRLVWAANDAPFSTRPEGGFEADISVMILQGEGVGFVRVGGIATPLLCLRSEPGEGLAGKR